MEAGPRARDSRARASREPAQVHDALPDGPGGGVAAGAEAGLDEGLAGQEDDGRVEQHEAGGERARVSPHTP